MNPNPAIRMSLYNIVATCVCNTVYAGPALKTCSTCAYLLGRSRWRAHPQTRCHPHIETWPVCVRPLWPVNIHTEAVVTMIHCQEVMRCTVCTYAHACTKNSLFSMYKVSKNVYQLVPCSHNWHGYILDAAAMETCEHYISEWLLSIIATCGPQAVEGWPLKAVMCRAILFGIREFVCYVLYNESLCASDFTEV